MATNENTVERAEIVEAMGEALGEKKARDLVEDASAELGVRRETVDIDTAFDILDAIGQRDDLSTLARVTANTSKAKLRS